MNHGFDGLLDFTDVRRVVLVGFWVACSWVLNQDLQDFEDYCRGELNSPSHDTDTFPYCRNNFTRRDAMLRVFSRTGFNVNSPAVSWVLNQDLQDFEDFTNVFVLGWEVIRRDVMLRIFSPTGFNVNFAVIIRF